MRGVFSNKGDHHIVWRIIKPILAKSGPAVKVIWSLFFIFLLVRLLEYFSYTSRYSHADLGSYLAGWRYDLTFASFAGLIFFPLYIFLPHRLWYSIRWAGIIVAVSAGLLTYFLSEYYLTTFIPLDHSLMVYSVSDVLYIASTSASFTFSDFLKIFIIIGFSFATPWLLLYRCKSSLVVTVIAFIPVLLSMTIFNNITPNIQDFKRNQHYYQQVNKTSYLIKELSGNLHRRSHYTDQDLPAVSRAFHSMLPHRHYPFLHLPFLREELQKDVLGSFFDLPEEEPNFVFIIVESLGRDFSGPGARWGSFTPFLDSLARQGLYWSNFLSTSERTFNALPSALASLPYGEKGFASLAEEDPYPDFFSLNEILKQEAGYKSHFFYGGWPQFDHMSTFLKETGIDYILGDQRFGKSYRPIEECDEGFSWGYPDHAVFERSMEVLDSLDHPLRTDIYLTLSTHDPFSPPSPEKWKRKFLKMLDTSASLKLERTFYERRKDQFSTILYADHAIRLLFDQYARRPEYSRTIFFIFGDHHLPMSSYTPLEKYHVPLIIFSPMVKEPRIFSGVSSVADITPSILGMMKAHYNIQTPQWVHWLGEPIDTSTTFQSTAFIPFMRINRDVDELVYGEFFLSEGRLFRIHDGMKITICNDPEKKKKLQEMLEAFNILSKQPRLL